MNGDWYSQDSWYAPLETEESKTGKKKKVDSRVKTRRRVIGISLLVIVLIIASSIGVAKLTGSPRPAVNVPATMPDSAEDFFSSYYTSSSSDQVNINITRAPLGGRFRLTVRGEETDALSLGELFESCSPSIVAIYGYINDKPGYSWGSGVILSEDGLVLTNTHVIEGCDRAEVQLGEEEPFEATLVGADSVSDIAVLKIEAKGLTPARFGDSAALSVGERVAAIGNPLGAEFRLTLTDGIVSAIERGMKHNGHTMNLIQTNTAINEGNSGGALFNMYGQVVGITNMKMTSYYSSIEGIGFAIPSSTVKTVVDSLIEFGVVKGRTSIGVTLGGIPAEAKEKYGMPDGLYVSAVQPNSDACAKGVQVGDVVTAINGESVTATDQVMKLKEALSVGDTMLFSIWREGESMEIEIELMDTNDLY